MAPPESEGRKDLEDDRLHFVRPLIKRTWVIEVLIAILLLLAFLVSKIVDT
jgi:hypothetical protein